MARSTEKKRKEKRKESKGYTFSYNIWNDIINN